MYLAAIFQWLTVEHLEALVNNYSSLGIFGAFLLPFIDSFIGLFPIWVFVMVNVAAFGFWTGLFISWIGSVTGAITFFLILRKLGAERVSKFLRRSKKVNRILGWIDNCGFGTIFILFCFPFTPTLFINICASLAKVRMAPYFAGMILGKLVMVSMVATVGRDLLYWVGHPIKAACLLAIIMLLWFMGRLMEKRIANSATSK